MNSVGIDVSKGKSTVSVMRPFGEIVLSPFEVSHTAEDLKELVEMLHGLDGETRVVMEATGKYHVSIAKWLHEAGFFVSVVNAILVHDYGNNKLRRAKTDKKDAVKIANYGLDHWLELQKYLPEEDTRMLLKACCRQYVQYAKVQTCLKNNLTSLLDIVFPGVNKLFPRRIRGDGTEKWVDFVSAFWHAECVSKLSRKAFSEKYDKWCKKHGYRSNDSEKIYSFAKNCACAMPKNESTHLLVDLAISQLQTSLAAQANLRKQILALASTLPEYPVVMAMYGIGPNTGPQLMAEIGDVRRFHSKKALVAFAGLDAPPYQSGQISIRSRKMSKRGSGILRRCLFLTMKVYLESAPADQPVYQYMDKKRAEGKPYMVYMMASANKFLRIYYATVKSYLDSLN